MPDISDAVLQDIQVRLEEFLKARPGYTTVTYIDSGGSAAIFRVDTPAGYRAIKVYDPKFFLESNAKAEARRLDLQRALIGHECPTLVAVYSVEEAVGTAFIEMEYVAWPQLKKVLPNVPDDKVSSLTQQLVEAVTFLEKLDIVHRDVKPENIHVTEDFSKLKLIDLGVARGLTLPDEEGAEATDHGKRRRFISTAQYSSPEYLFRLDAPSPSLWKALNLYQVGAVLHDLINKRALFQDEVDIDNRFVVAKAVLTKTPTFPDTDPTRLATQKALAARCLAKDMNTRLQIVGWSDFTFETSTDPLAALKSRLAKGAGLAGSQAAASAEERLQFEREIFSKRFCESIRTELIAAANKAVQITMMQNHRGAAFGYSFSLAIGAVTVVTEIRFDWFEDMQNTSARVSIGAVIKSGESEVPQPSPQVIATATINQSEEVVSLEVAHRVAEVLGQVLDMLDSVEDKSVLHGTDVGQICFGKG
ncbi:MAG: protein kinase [Xanthomonadaceae bacterium]|nr:protein kinase [Xanthomonadaceae bacterium]